MGKILIPLVGLLLMSSLVGCNTAGCTDLRSSVPRADFYSSTTGKTISVDSLEIMGVGVPGDSILYGPSERLSSIYLPMPPEVNSVQWSIRYMQEDFRIYDIADYITLDFERYPWFAGEECGAMYKYRITNLAYTRNVIDSVAILDSMVVNVDQPSLAIYFPTAD